MTAGRLLKSLLIALAVAAGLTLPAAARQAPYQVDPSVDKRFADAVRFYVSKEYAQARAAFEEIRAASTINQRTTGAYVMAAKCELALGRYESVAPILIELFQRFPESGYHADAYYTLGMTSFVTHKYSDAARHLIRSVELAKDTALLAHAADLFEYVAGRFLREESLRQLYASARGELPKDLVRLKLVELLVASGEPTRARVLLDDTLGRAGPTPYEGRLNGLRRKLSESVSVKIGALLPLMRGSEPSAVKILAEELLEGMQFALAERRAERPAVSVSLDVRDIGRDSLSAVRGLQELAKSPETIAVVGPVFSNIAFLCAPVAEAAGLPMISPTATSNGLAAIGEHIFQANPDFSMRGKAMAQFAVSQLGLRRVAVLSPTEGVGKFVAESFLQEARRLGMQVVGAESYPPGVGDLREQCMRLRRAAADAVRQISFGGKVPDADIKKMLEAGARREILDSARARGGVVSALELFGSDRGGAIADSLRLSSIVPQPDPEDVDVPLTQLDGLFLPVTDAEEIGAIGPQISFFNIKTQLLGSNEWYDLGQLNEHKRYVNGVMFASDTYVSAEDPAYAAFDAAYLAAIKKRPTKYSLYGYDAMKLLLQRIDAGAVGREELARQLGIVAHFSGIHSTITLKSGRVNSDLHVLQFSDGRVMEIGEVSVQ